MREKAVNRCEQFKLWYGDALEEKAVKELSEASAIGMSQTYVNHCQNIDAPSNLYAALIPDSHVSAEIMDYLAKECGGVFVQDVGQKDGDATKELIAAIELCAQGLKAHDNEAREQKITAAIKQLEKGRKDIR